MELFEFHAYGEKLFDLILVLRYIFISHFISSSVIFKTTVEVYMCIHLPNQLYLFDNSLLSNNIYPNRYCNIYI